MIDDKFVQKIADLASVQTFTVEGRTYATEALHEVKPAPTPRADLVKVVTLAGFGDLITNKLESLNKADFIIHVESEDTVTLKQLVSDFFGRRLKLIEAKPVAFKAFPFGQWLKQEEFVIGVASLFSQTPDKDYVMSIAGSLTNEEVSTAEDNGFSQKATVKAGMKIAETVQLKPQVELAPFRTFPEVGQPISKFVFRARGGDSPSLMLVEADGGKWKLDAINEVRRYLATLSLGIEIIA
jgi:hypothetical protein